MITDSTIALGDRMGAQLSKIASLIYVCKKNGQQLVLWNELKDFRRGFCFLETFDIGNIEYIERAGKFKKRILKFCNDILNKKNDDWLVFMNRMSKNLFFRCLYKFLYEWICMDYKDFRKYKLLKNGVHTDSSLLQLGSTGNFDINSGFGTYRDWGEYEDFIKNSFRFRDEIKSKGNRIFQNVSSASPKKKISVHLRRTDYLVASSLNLDESYYQKAFSYFNPDECQFLIFSDDIEECKKMNLFNNPELGGIDFVFMSPDDAGVDMYLMTLCDGNIIANSTFSFWGAFPNRHENKKVVCPHDFIGENVKEYLYINGNYYPESWIAI